MKTYGGVDAKVRVLLTSVLVGDEWSASRPGRFTAHNYQIGDWVGPTAGLDAVEIILDPTGTRTPTSWSSSQSLYRLSYIVRTKLEVSGEPAQAEQCLNGRLSSRRPKDVVISLWVDKQELWYALSRTPLLYMMKCKVPRKQSKQKFFKRTEESKLQ
jgi:hypothetical protein